MDQPHGFHPHSSQTVAELNSAGSIVPLPFPTENSWRVSSGVLLPTRWPYDSVVPDYAATAPQPEPTLFTGTIGQGVANIDQSNFVALADPANRSKSRDSDLRYLEPLPISYDKARVLNYVYVAGVHKDHCESPGPVCILLPISSDKQLLPNGINPNGGISCGNDGSVETTQNSQDSATVAGSPYLLTVTATTPALDGKQQRQDTVLPVGAYCEEQIKLGEHLEAKLPDSSAPFDMSIDSQMTMGQTTLTSAATAHLGGMVVKPIDNLSDSESQNQVTVSGNSGSSSNNYHIQAGPASMTDSFVDTGTSSTIAASSCVTNSQMSSAAVSADIPSGLYSPSTEARGSLWNGRIVSCQAGSWSDKFRQLQSFQARHGHCTVNPKLDPSLAQWIKRQRYQFKLRMAGYHSTLSSDRIKALNGIGFVWQSHKTVWNQRFAELVEFKERNGHCNVPTEYRANRALGAWLKAQKRQYALRMRGCKSTITEERIQRLENIGLQWALRHRKPVKHGLGRKSLTDKHV